MRFFFHDSATTEIYTLSLTTLFRSTAESCVSFCSRMTEQIVPLTTLWQEQMVAASGRPSTPRRPPSDRKSTRLNSSHGYISYAVFCLKKKKKQEKKIKHNKQHNT